MGRPGGGAPNLFQAGGYTVPGLAIYLSVPGVALAVALRDSMVAADSTGTGAEVKANIKSEKAISNTIDRLTPYISATSNWYKSVSSNFCFLDNFESSAVTFNIHGQS